MSEYDFTKPNCDWLELDKRIKKLESGENTSLPSTYSNGNTAAYPDSFYTYGGGMSHVVDFSFFDDLPKNCFGVIDGKAVFSFDIDLYYNTYHRGLLSFRCMADEEEFKNELLITARASNGINSFFDAPNVSGHYDSDDYSRGCWHSIYQFYWGETTADFSSEVIGLGLKSGSKSHSLNLVGDPLQPYPGTYASGFVGYCWVDLQVKTYDWHPNFSPDVAKGQWVAPVFVWESKTMFVQKKYTSTINWANCYNNDTYPPQKTLTYNWGYNAGNYPVLPRPLTTTPKVPYPSNCPPLQSETYQDEFYAMYVDIDFHCNWKKGGIGPLCRVSAGEQYPEAIAAKIPSSWNAM